MNLPKLYQKKGHTFSAFCGNLQSRTSIFTSDPISGGWMTSKYIKFGPWLLNPFRKNVVIKLDHLPKKWKIEIVNETINW